MVGTKGSKCNGIDDLNQFVGTEAGKVRVFMDAALECWHMPAGH